MRRSRQAPASSANRRSRASKNGLYTPFETYQKLSPVADVELSGLGGDAFDDLVPPHSLDAAARAQ